MSQDQLASVDLHADAQQRAELEREADGAQLKLAVIWMQHELRRFKISDRPRTLAQLILTLSWGDGLPAVLVPKLEVFRELTGLNPSHISTALGELELMRVITIEEMPSGRRYAINPCSHNWQATPRVSRSSVDQAVNLLREINGIPAARSTSINFKVGVLTVFLVDQPTNSVIHTKTA